MYIQKYLNVTIIKGINFLRNLISIIVQNFVTANKTLCIIINYA